MSKSILNEYITGNLENDIWHLKDDFQVQNTKCKNTKIDFTMFKKSIREELKFYFAYSVKNSIFNVETISTYKREMIWFNNFLNQYFPNIDSLLEIDIKELNRLYEISPCIVAGDRNKKIIDIVIPFLYKMLGRSEDVFENDVWYRDDFPNKQELEHITKYKLSFVEIPVKYRYFVKSYIRNRLNNITFLTCSGKLRKVKEFIIYIEENYTEWTNFSELNTQDINKYIEYLYMNFSNFKTKITKQLFEVRSFLEYIQLTYPDKGPKVSVNILLNINDIPRYNSNFNPVGEEKYIPKHILNQFDEKIENIRNKMYLPIAITLRATGWRIGDVLNLKYDNCLEESKNGFYIVGDIRKTRVLNHKVPISIEVAMILKNAIDNAIMISNEDNNPNKYLFINTKGRRKGKPITSKSFSEALNKWAVENDIQDIDGSIYRFKTHAFRHSKAVELINSGMNLTHVQKWMAHLNPEMTLAYAKILDSRKKQEWLEALENGFFKLDINGKVSKISSEDEEYKDITDWQYIKENLDVVNMHLGYCMKPKKIPCAHQLNPCLSCEYFYTNKSFKQEFENEINKVNSLICEATKLNRQVWIEKNTKLLNRLQNMYDKIIDGSDSNDI